MTKLPVWVVRAWVTAPGDFPEKILRTVAVDAHGVLEAAARGAAKASEGFIEPITVVTVARSDPAWNVA